MGPVIGARADDPPLVQDVHWLRIDHPSAVGAARRAGAELAERLGLKPPRSDNLQIAVSEVADNVLKHAGSGSILLRACRSERGPGVEFVAIDAGPGILDVDAALLDGRSTAGTLGIGLGALTRLAEDWDIHTVPGAGTVVAASFGACDAGGRAAGLTRPMNGQDICGDAYAIRVDDGVVTVLLADGLGHGALAATASGAAVRAFLAASPAAPGVLLERIHPALHGTRGAAAAIAQVASPTELLYAGVGNIAGHLLTGDSKRGLVSFAGILGVNGRTPRQLSYPLERDTVVVLHSDGVTERMSLSASTGVLRRSPLVIAATVLRDFGVRNDDAGVLVIRPGDFR